MDIDRKNTNSPPKATKIPGINRRGVVKGLASTPLIMTIASRPVWAETCSVSGHLSGNLSNPNEVATCVLTVFSIASLSQSNGGDMGSLYNAIWNVLPFNSTDKLTTLPNITFSGSPFTGTIDEALTGADPDLQVKTAAFLNFVLWQEMVSLYETTVSTAVSEYVLLSSTGFYFPVTEASVTGNEAVTSWSSYEKI